jgi:two-component system response regulator AlgR
MSTAMRPISVFIVDDESLARERLKRLLQNDSAFEVCGEAENGEQAIERALQLRPDIVILDIRMPGTDGLEVAAYLSSMKPAPSIIFCTAYDEYAIKAFDYNAIAYLLKPIRQEDLLKSLHNAGQLSQVQLKRIEEQSLADKPATSFIANTWNGMEKLLLTDIFYFRADHKYVTVIHKGGETLSDQTLKEIETQYPNELLRTHRNSLVNRYHIQSLHRQANGQYLLDLSEKHHVAVSRRMVSEVKAALNEL